MSRLMVRGCGPSWLGGYGRGRSLSIQSISWGEEMPAGVQLFSFHSVQVPRLSDNVAPLHLTRSGNYPTDEPGGCLVGDSKSSLVGSED